MHDFDAHDLLKQLTGELENFTDMAAYLLPQPGDVPELQGIDVHGGTVARNGAIGGDHIIYVDFKRRFDLHARIMRATSEGQHHIVERLKSCQRKAGIALLDVSGHRVTDALLAAMLHQAFLLGSIYELDMFGQITERLFEHLNTRFYQSSAAHKFVSLIYGEISEDTGFRFLAAAQPFPSVFSNEHDRLMDVRPELNVSFPPLGMLPSSELDRQSDTSPLGFKARYEMNEWSLMGTGDILVLHTDGVTEHGGERRPYYPLHFGEALRRRKHLPAREIYEGLRQDLLAFDEPSDDISLVVIKRT